MTRFEALMTISAAILAMLTTLVVVVWRARGWIDRLNTTDSSLAKAIADLAATQRELHRQNQARFAALEARLPPPPRRPRARVT